MTMCSAKAGRLEVLYAMGLIALLSSATLAETADFPVCHAENGRNNPTRKTCDILLAQSAVQSGRLGLFSAIDRYPGEYVSEPDVAIPILDANRNEWSPWHDLVWPGSQVFRSYPFESYFLSSSFLPGIHSIAACSNKFNNIELSRVLAYCVELTRRNLVRY